MACKPILKLNRKKYIEFVIPKLSLAYFAMRTVTSLMTTDNLNYLHCLTNVSFGKLHLTAKWYSTSNRKVLHEWQLGEEEEEGKKMCLGGNYQRN